MKPLCATIIFVTVAAALCVFSPPDLPAPWKVLARGLLLLWGVWLQRKILTLPEQWRKS